MRAVEGSGGAFLGGAKANTRARDAGVGLPVRGFQRWPAGWKGVRPVITLRGARGKLGLRLAVLVDLIQLEVEAYQGAYHPGSYGACEHCGEEAPAPLQPPEDHEADDEGGEAKPLHRALGPRGSTVSGRQCPLARFRSSVYQAPPRDLLQQKCPGILCLLGLPLPHQAEEFFVRNPAVVLAGGIRRDSHGVVLPLAESHPTKK